MYGPGLATRVCRTFPLPVGVLGREVDRVFLCYTQAMTDWDSSLVAALYAHGFIRQDETLSIWNLYTEGNPTKELSVEFRMTDGKYLYILYISHFPGGEGYEDDKQFSDVDDLIAVLPGWVDWESEPEPKKSLFRRILPC